MTPEEAIGIVRCAIGEVEWNYPMDYSVAFEVAIEALEKQIAKSRERRFNQDSFGALRAVKQSR